MVAPQGHLGTMVVGPENTAKTQRYINRHNLHSQEAWDLLKMWKEKQVDKRNNNESSASPPPGRPPCLPRLGHVSLLCTPMAPIATQHLLPLIEMICFYVQRVTHLLGMYPFGRCIPRSQQTQKMTVFVAVTVLVIVSSANMDFIALCGFVATALLWRQSGRWLPGIPSRIHKPHHEKS